MKLGHIGDDAHLPVQWKRLRDEQRWPGRELAWVWSHPALSLLIVYGATFTLVGIWYPWLISVIVAFIVSGIAVLVVWRMRVEGDAQVERDA